MSRHAAAAPAAAHAPSPGGRAGEQQARQRSGGRAVLSDLPWLLMAAGIVVGVAVLDPATSPLAPPCPVRWATGFACPGCGSGRALHALLHGEFCRALTLNPVAVLALPLVLLGLGALAHQRWTGRPVAGFRGAARWGRARLGWVVLGGLLLWAVVRNVAGLTP